MDDFLFGFNAIAGNEEITIPAEVKKERDNDYDLPYEIPEFDDE